MCTIGPLDKPQTSSSEPESYSSVHRLEAIKAENALLVDRLRQSEARFRELLEGASDAVLEVSDDGKILFANSATFQMFGYTPEELLGQEVEILLPPGATREMHRHHRANYAEHPRIRRMGTGYELSACREDGTVIPVEISLIPLWSHDRPGVITIVHDISKRKRTEEKLRQAQKLEALSRLAGGTAHEFNNLLTVIMGSAELILMFSQPDEQARQVERIRRATTQAGGLSRQLLSFGRKQTLCAEMLDLNALVLELSSSCREFLGDSIEFQLVPARAPVWIRADCLQIEQAIRNLMSNARNAMALGGKVVLTLETVEFGSSNGHNNPGLPLGQYALLSIADTGTGMTPTVKARLFEPFFSTRGMAEATGMGLASAYGIVTQSGGTISVESQPDRGTTFRLYLPSVSKDARKIKAASAPDTDNKHSGATILFLEDQPDLLLLTSEFLRQIGYHVLSASHPDDALRIASDYQGTIDLLVSDILMPGMDGREAARRCKAMRPSLPVLYVSGYTADILDQLESGEDFMSKPFAPEELGLKIRGIISLAKANKP